MYYKKHHNHLHNTYAWNTVTVNLPNVVNTCYQNSLHTTVINLGPPPSMLGTWVDVSRSAFTAKWSVYTVISSFLHAISRVTIFFRRRLYFHQSSVVMSFILNTPLHERHNCFHTITDITYYTHYIVSNIMAIITVEYTKLAQIEYDPWMCFSLWISYHYFLFLMVNSDWSWSLLISYCVKLLVDPQYLIKDLSTQLFSQPWLPASSCTQHSSATAT